MNQTIDWSKITHNTFEKLSLDFIQKEYPDFDWLPTKKVNDGNKDIFASKKVERLTNSYDEEYWVEAKYKSDITATLSKGQLDPTIVSGIISNNVKSIAFITNARYTQNYLIRAKKAFIDNDTSKEILFIDNDHLEDWLYQNTEIYLKYFQSNLSKKPSKDIEIKNGFFIELSNEINNIFSPCQTLELNHDYVLYLFINSHTNNQKVNVTFNESLFFIHKQYDSFLNLGLNYIKLLVTPYVVYNNHIDLNIETENNILKYKLSTNNIIESKNIKIIYNDQEDKKLKIENIINKSESCNVIINLYAEAGLGKTFLLQDIQSMFGLDNQSLYVRFTYSKNNYSMLCKVIIFLNFGNFYDQNLNSIFSNLELLPQEILDGLYKGITNQEDAIYILDKILKKNIKVIKENPKNSFKLLLLDDIYKLDENSWSFLEYLLTEFNSSNINIKVLCATRRAEHSINQTTFFDNIVHYSYDLKTPTPTDVIATIEDNIGPAYIDPSIINNYPINILFLTKFVKELIKMGINFSKRIESINQFNNLYEEIIKNDKIFFKNLFQKIQNSLFHIIYIFETGIKEEHLYEFFTSKYNVNEELNKLKKLNLIKLESSEFKLTPFHDIYSDNYKKIYLNIPNNNQIVSFFKFLLNKDSINRIYILNILVRIDIRHRNKYLQELLKYRDDLYLNKNYAATILLSKTIIKIYEGFNNKSNYEIIDSYYKYADSLNYCSNIIDSKNNFEFVKSFGKYSSDLKIKELVYSAQSEIISLEYWQLQVTKNTIKNINNFKNELSSFIDNISTPSSYIVHAYLTSLNRLMTNYLLLDEYENADKLFHILIQESDKHSSIANKGYAYMDYAKGLYAYNIKRAYKYLLKAQKIFYQLNTENRRLLDCEIEILYIQTLFSRQILDKLITKSNDLLINGYDSIYLKSILKIATFNILNLNIQEAIDNINLIFKLKGSSENRRVDMLISNLYSAIYYLEHNNSEKNKWIDDHCNLVNKLGEIYKAIAVKNKTLSSTRKEISIDFKSKNIFLLDPRMW